MLRYAVLAGCGLLFLTAGATAQVPMPLVSAAEAGPVPPPGAVAVLLQQASFWAAQQQYDQALASLRRALRIAPGNLDAWARIGQIEADRGNRPGAEAAQASMRAAAPDDPRIASIERSLRVGPIAPEALAEARHLALDGRQGDAILRYDRVLRGMPPPDSLAVEYYETLSGTEGGWDAARDGLARVLSQNPHDLRAQLAYAQILTYREASREDGIARLQALARNAAVADHAAQSWRRALLWLPVRPEMAPLLAAYLAVHPTDADLQARLAAVRRPAGDEAGQSRMRGFDRLAAGRLDQAAQLFQHALQADPNDADAAGGLGIVRLRQHDPGQARGLLQRAIDLDPDHKERWTNALAAAGTPIAGKAAPNPATALLARGDDPRAEQTLRRQIEGGDPDPGLRVMLATAEARQGRLDDAERAFRDALGRAPRQVPALLGLADLLTRRRRFAEAAALLDRAEAGGTRGSGSDGRVGQVRARLLRARAEAEPAETEPAERAALLQAAVEADPHDPWTRLDLARALLHLGRPAEARAGMVPLTAPSAPPEALRAAIVFARETGDAAAAAALVARLPPSARTPDLVAVQQAAAIAREVGEAAATSQAGGPEAASLLLALARRPDPTGARGSAIARALVAIGRPDMTEAALGACRAATPGDPAAARLAYAATLLAVGQQNAAARQLAGLEPAGLPAPLRDALFGLRTGLAIRASDALNERGRQAEAFELLAPLLADRPADAALNLAVARLFGGAGRPRDALARAETVLGRDPTNAEARRIAAQAALAAGETGRAERIIRAGLALAPADPNGWVAAADLARANGDIADALRDLQQARTLRLRQLTAHREYPAVDYPAPAPSFQLLAPDPRAGPDDALAALPEPVAAPAAGSSPANPFRADLADVPADGTDSSADKLTRRIVADIAVLQERIAPAAEAGASVRGRSGAAGLDSLTELDTPLATEFSLAGGRVRARLVATPIVLAAGTLHRDVPSFAQFGMDALGLQQARAGRAPLPDPGSQDAAGLGLSASATLGDVAADLGTTPLGFPERNLVGGIVWAPPLSDHLRLRLLAERRAVTDSLLSYAGTRLPGVSGPRPPQPGTIWGGVVLSRGHANLEFSLGPLDLYAGGGAGVLTGHDVARNVETDAGAGASVVAWRSDTQQVRVGLDLVYFGYERNLRFFSYGQGGYFSPQAYLAMLLPVTWTDRVSDDLSVEIGGSVGLQAFREGASPVYPTRPSSQALLEALQTGGQGFVPGLPVTYPGQSVSGFAGGLHGAIDYLVTPALHVGARVDYRRAGTYDQAAGVVYGRYVFDGRDVAVPSQAP